MKLYNVKFVINKDGKFVIIFCVFELIIIDEFGCIKEKYKLLYGFMLSKVDGDVVVVGEIVVNWEVYIMLIIIEVVGCV